MRKLLYTTVLLVFSSWGTSAQNWYNLQDMLGGMTNGLANTYTYIRFLMPDSIAQCMDTSGYHRNYPVAAGHITDPKDEVIERTANPTSRMSLASAYSLDSFYIRYAYVRNVDTLADGSKVIDTLLVSYLTANDLPRSIHHPPVGRSFAYVMPSWNINTLQLSQVTAQEKFLLTDADSTMVLTSLHDNIPESTWRLKNMFRKVGPSVHVSAGSNNYVGVVFQFKPGMPYDTSSVMYYQDALATFPPEKTRVNYFGLIILQNYTDKNSNPVWLSDKYVNHSLFSYRQNAYYNSGQVNNNWGGFIPGNAFQEPQHLLFSVKLTEGIPSGLPDADLISIRGLYPNPANAAVYINFSLKQAAQVALHITNLVGQEVISSEIMDFTAGDHTFPADLQGFEAGIYFVSITVNGTTLTRKLVVNK